MDFSDPGVGNTVQNIEGIQSPSHPLTNSPPSISWNYSIGNMLAWMTSELLKAEQAGEKVHILSHVPAGTLLPISYFHVLCLYCLCSPVCPCISPLKFVRYIVWFNHWSHPKTYSTHMYLDYQLCSMTKLRKKQGNLDGRVCVATWRFFSCHTL